MAVIQIFMGEFSSTKMVVNMRFFLPGMLTPMALVQLAYRERLHLKIKFQCGPKEVAQRQDRSDTKGLG